MAGYPDSLPGIYTLSRAEEELPLLFDSPHSGRTYPDDFQYVCPFHMLQAAEDRYVDKLFDHVTGYGALFLKAHFPRTYIDVNRARDDIDLHLIKGDWPYPVAGDGRSHAGIGLVRRLVRPGLPLYAQKLTPCSVLRRIENYYAPYHNKLSEEINRLHYKFGQVWYINCHSMPPHTALPRASVNRRAGPAPRPYDFVLGTRDGQSAHDDLVEVIRTYLEAHGYTVGINDPYKGVEQIRLYNAPDKGIHAIQLEINKALYLNSTGIELSRNMPELHQVLTGLTARLAGELESRLIDRAAD